MNVKHGSQYCGALYSSKKQLIIDRYQWRHTVRLAVHCRNDNVKWCTYTRCSLCRLCRVAAIFISASDPVLSQEIPTVKWMSNQPAHWTPDINNNYPPYVIWLSYIFWRKPFTSSLWPNVLLNSLFSNIYSWISSHKASNNSQNYYFLSDVQEGWFGKQKDYFRFGTE
jgi:hypothetical protein